MVTYVYVLGLVGGKYYVGKTTNPNFRLNDHFNSQGSTWTAKYKPIKVIEIIGNCDNYDEDKYTLKYMEKYGINNVRGGSFCGVTLSEENKNTINKMINGSTDKCYACGKIGHFVDDCDDSGDDSDDDGCFRCHRIGHFAAECYAKTYADGDVIDDGELYTCTKTNTRITYQISTKCRRCGRDNHNASNCFANRHVKGYYL